MVKKRRITKNEQKRIAIRRIIKLFNLAEENALSNNLRFSDRYVELARKISMKNLTPIPKEYKRRFCKYCYHYLLPTVTCRVRIKSSKVIVFCKNNHSWLKTSNRTW